MDSTWLVLTALAFGIFLGAAFMVVLHMAERRGSSAARVVAPTIPDGIDQVLEVLESAGVVLDPSNNVLKASPGALAMGLVRQGALVHPELLDLVASVRRDGEPVAEELSLARGPFGESTLRLHVRVARLGTRFVLVLAEDRTEAHRLDEVRRDFVANISHELKTPIASVSLLAEALDQAADEPDQVRRFAGRLSVEASRLAHITSEVIELSRLQARDALRPDVLVDIDEVIAAAVDQNRVVAASKHVDVAVRASHEGGGLRRPGPPGRRGAQPHRQRDRVLQRRRPRRRRRQGRRTASSRSPSPTRASASRATSSSACSSASTASTRRARATPAAPASDSAS